MKNISLNIDKVAGFASKETIAAYEPQVKACMETLENGTGKGNDFLGWLHLPSSITAEHLAHCFSQGRIGHSERRPEPLDRLPGHFFQFLLAGN